MSEVKPERDRLKVLPVRVTVWQYDALCRRSIRRGVSLGEALRAILEAVLASERTS